ncbi:acyltransferase family protein [Thermaerobacillus caldiproteolyticus]|uniref:acyltransferase family protein n=1 Tax=Thermaerobacillus caldiproteolyticus TaxID=247480 RepID=UPI00188A80FF|nr:acyltransferase family protein [Anoxybacillus caldiproteolyticus]QPA32761.1 acyltransferase family protein [Anoxybacillus caldiproteolyticus]
MSERDCYFDNAKCFLMLLVVFGHFLRPYIDSELFVHSLYVWIFFFHMPAFILISGYFAKGFRQHGYLKKITKKLLLPYLIFQLLYSIYYSFLYEKDTVQIDVFTPHWSLWFLISLFSWNILLWIFANIPKHISLLIALLLGVGAGMIEAEKWLSLSRTFTFFPFFLMGFFLQKSHFERLLTRRVRLFSLIALIGMFICIHLGFPDLPQEWLYGSKSYETLGVHEEKGAIGRLIIYGASAFMMFCFMALIPNRRLPISTLGTRTFYIYILHGFILKYLHVTHFPDFIMDIHGYPLLLLLSLFVMFILGSEPIVRLVRPLIEWRFPKKKRAVS